MRMKEETLFISIGCNRSTNSLKYSIDGVCIYAANTMVALLYPNREEDFTTKRTFIGHKSSVSCIEIFYLAQNPRVPFGFVSASVDGQLIIWSFQTSKEDAFDAKIEISHQCHTASITSIACLNQPYKDEVMTLITSGADNTIKIIEYSFKLKEVKERQVISLQRHYALTTALTIIPFVHKYILAFGSTDTHIYIYIEDESGTFQQAFKLQGHENWIQSLQFSLFKTTSFDIYLASASQDKHIRLWSIRPTSPSATTTFLKLHKLIYQVNADLTLECALESLLVGHDHWIYSCQWKITELVFDNDTYWNQEKLLISASSDGLLMIWKFDPSDSLWKNIMSLGDLGDSFGYYGAILSQDKAGDHMIIAHSHSGSLQYWKYSSINEEWINLPLVTGHVAAVESVCWHPTGEYFASVSDDQTTRIFAPFKRSHGITWHEINRAQIHGYNMNSIAFLPDLKFVSAGDEKVIRVFEATKSFVRLKGLLSKVSEDVIKMEEDKVSCEQAEVPALGLTSKSVSTNLVGAKTNLTGPPTEHYISKSTLWPEIEKLYGHAYEIFTLAINPSFSLLASSCKSTTAEYAAIRIWRTSDWKLACPPLLGHSLTVTKMAFKGNRLASVGRDRKFIIYEYNDLNEFKLLDSLENAHTRIIWSVDWLSSKELVTVGRDKKVKIWTVDNSKLQLLADLELECSITEVAVLPTANPSFIVGLENGKLLYSQFNRDKKEKIQIQYEFKEKHADFIKKIQVRPMKEEYPDFIEILTASSDDALKLVRLMLI